MVAAPDLSPEVIASRIQAAFRAKKIAVEAENGVYGVRTAARNIAARGTEPKISESSWRLQLQRILKAEAIKPHASTRRLLAEEFGVPPEHFGVASEMVRVASGGAHFAEAWESIADARHRIVLAHQSIDKLERQLVLLAETREGVAA